MPSTAVIVHVGDTAPGFVEVTTRPESSIATHRVAVGHDTSGREWVPSTFVTVHAPAPPVGFVEVTTSPTSSTATQSEAEGHETPNSWCE